MFAWFHDFRFLLFWPGLWLTLVSPLAAQDVRLELEAIHLGIDGHVRHGRWAELSMKNKGGSKGYRSPESNNGKLLVEAISRDGDGVPVVYSADAPVGFKNLSLPVKIGPPKSGLTIRVSQGDLVLSEMKLSEASLGTFHRSTTDLIGVVGQNEVGITQAAEWLNRERADDIEAFSIFSASVLPENPRGYDAIERLCVVIGKENPLADLDNEQHAALLQWIRGGGNLYVMFCPGYDKPVHSEADWKAFLPGELGTAQAITTDVGLKTFANEPLPFELASINDKPQIVPINVPRQQVLQWESGSATQDRPLVVETPLGFGRVTCVMVDMSHPRLAEWTGRSRFWARVFHGKTLSPHEVETNISGGRVTHRGYQDLTGQLRSALDQYEQVTPIHFYAVAGAMLAYLLILGPGEYFLLHRFSRQSMQVTWFILPVLVLGVVAGGIWVGRHSHGQQERVNHLELLDLDTISGKQRGMFWTGIFTPRSRDFSLTATPNLANVPGSENVQTEFAWQALPGDGLGGVDTPPLASVMPNRYRIHTADAAAKLTNLPIASAGSKLLTGNWWGDFSPGENIAKLHRGKIKSFEGSFRNISPYPLKQAYIVHGEYLYKAADDLSPGATISIDRLKRPLHLESYLIRRTSIASNDLATPWNGDDADIPRILEIMMFHDASGGENYTVLANRYQPELDLSRLLKQGHAVLVGRVATPFVQLQEDGSPLAPDTTRRWSFVRIIYPVAARSEESTAPEQNIPAAKPFNITTE